MLPALRKRLKTISDSNKGLQDILQSMQKGTEILSVEPYNGKVHNTKITLLIDKGSNYPEQERYEERVHFYNRVALKKAIPINASYPKTSVKDAIDALNLQHGCDFTEDDVELIDNVLSAKEMSLGYYNTIVECTNVVNLNWYKETDIGSEFAYAFQDWVSNLRTPLVKSGQKWYFGSGEESGSLLHSSNYVSNSLYQRYIGPYNEMLEESVSKITNVENEHFQLKFIYVFKDDRIYDQESEGWVNGFTKSGSLKKLLLGPHQTNNNVTVDSYPLEQLWTRYPELESENYLETAQTSIFYQNMISVYEPIPDQANQLVIEINILYCPNPNCNPTNLSMRRFGETIPETHQNGALTIQLIKNGTTTTEIIRPSQVQGMTVNVINMISQFAESQDISFVGSGGGIGQFLSYGGDIKGARNEDYIPGNPGSPELYSADPVTMTIMKTQGESEMTDIFIWLLQGESGLDEETLAQARSLGLPVRSCGTQYWDGI